MQIAQSCAAVIPCLNEGKTIATLVKEVAGYLSNVIVVDDGSGDSTATAAECAGAIVVRREETGGKGAALGDGFRKAAEMHLDWALALDGDGQHAAREIPSFLSHAENFPNVRMVVGNRMEDTSRMPILRKWANSWMSRRLSRYCGRSLPDSQCGFRLLHLGSWRRLEFGAQHFEIESELLLRFVLSGMEVQFIPIETRYAGEESKIHPVRDTIRWFKWWHAIRREFRDEPPVSFELNDPVEFSAATLK